MSHINCHYPTLIVTLSLLLHSLRPSSPISIRGMKTRFSKYREWWNTEWSIWRIGKKWARGVFRRERLWRIARSEEIDLSLPFGQVYRCVFVKARATEGIIYSISKALEKKTASGRKRNFPAALTSSSSEPTPFPLSTFSHKSYAFRKLKKVFGDIQSLAGSSPSILCVNFKNSYYPSSNTVNKIRETEFKISCIFHIFPDLHTFCARQDKNLYKV